MKKALLQYITRLTTGAPILVLATAGVVTVLALIRVLGMPAVQTDVLTLLPDSSPQARTYRRTIRQFGSFDYLLVVIESNRPNREDMLVRIAERFTTAVQTPLIFDFAEEGEAEVQPPPPPGSERGQFSYRQYIQSIEYDPGWLGRERSAPEMKERLNPALLTESELDQIAQIVGSRLEQRLLGLRTFLNRPLSLEKHRKYLRDPLKLHPIEHRDRTEPKGPIKGPMRNGMFISRDGRMLIMVIRPDRPATDLVMAQKLMEWLRGVADYVLATVPAEPANYQIGFIGSHAEVENAASIVLRDLTLTLIASVVLVLLLFILAVRRLGAIFFVGIPLLCALIWTLGAASFLYERITVVTCAFGVAIIGLGIDYAIHLYNRYLEERVGGAGVRSAIETALCQTGQGVLVGGVTTAIGFYGLYFTGFEGFQELGVVGGAGIFCCLAAMLFILPSLVVLSERVPEKLGLHRRPSRLGLRRLVNTIRSYPRLTLTVGLIITAYLGYYAQEVDFNEDVRNFRDPPAHYDDLVRRAENRFELPATQLIAIVSASTLEEALRNNDILYQKLEDASRLYPILAFDSLRPTLPSIQTQAATQERLKEILDLDTIENEVRSIANRLDLSTTRVIQRLEPLREWRAAATEENRVRFGDQSSLAFESLVRRHVASSSYRFYVVTSIYPRQGEWNRDEARDLALFLYENVPSIELTGSTFVGNALKRLVKQGMVRAVLLVAAAISLLLILHFRSTRKTLVAVVPVFASMVWTLGTMRLLGIDLNFLNISVIPLILGLGIDDGLHILQRYYEGGRRDLSAAISKTGRAVVLTSMTTMLAFGTLTFATFRGVRGIGLVAVLGVGYALIAALFLVPALLQMAGERLRWSDLLSEEEERRSHNEEFTEFLADEEQSLADKDESKKT